jgi:hypothetical protein
VWNSLKKNITGFKFIPKLILNGGSVICLPWSWPFIRVKTVTFLEFKVTAFWSSLCTILTEYVLEFFCVTITNWIVLEPLLVKMNVLSCDAYLMFCHDVLLFCIYVRMELRVLLSILKVEVYFELNHLF